MQVSIWSVQSNTIADFKINLVCSDYNIYEMIYNHGGYLFIGESIRECDWLVPQSPRLRLLVVGDRREHTDAESAVSGTFCSHCGKLSCLSHSVKIGIGCHKNM